MNGVRKHIWKRIIQHSLKKISRKQSKSLCTLTNSLITTNMKMIKVSDIFDVKYGVNLELVHLEECGKNEEGSINFVSRTEKNNGVSSHVQRLPDVVPNPAGSLSVAGGGSVLSTFYQKQEYYSGRDIYVLIPKKN